MTSPLPLPDWVPLWVHLALLVAALLVGIMFLLMPFSVFGVKGRLDLMEARLDEIQGEIRSLALRLPEPGREDVPGLSVRDRYDGGRPPIPPAPRDRPPAGPARPPAGTPRTEPRLY